MEGKRGRKGRKKKGLTGKSGDVVEGCNRKDQGIMQMRKGEIGRRKEREIGEKKR